MFIGGLSWQTSPGKQCIFFYHFCIRSTNETRPRSAHKLRKIHRLAAVQWCIDTRLTFLPHKSLKERLTKQISTFYTTLYSKSSRETKFITWFFFSSVVLFSLSLSFLSIFNAPLLCGGLLRQVSAQKNAQHCAESRICTSDASIF